MAKVTAIGQPVNNAERDVIFYLRNNLPDTFEILHNLEICQGKEVFELDLVVIAPHCVFVVDIKGTCGRIDIYGSKWHPQERSPYPSPVALLRKHAKGIKTLVRDANYAKPELSKVHVQPLAILTASDILIADHTGTDEPYITYADQRCLDYLQSHDFIPNHRSADLRGMIGTIRQAIIGKSAPRSPRPCYRDWQVIETLGRTQDYTEYRAYKIFSQDIVVRLKVYQVDPYMGNHERQDARRLISNAYQSLMRVPPHPNILGAIDFFTTSDEDCYVLVTHDLEGRSLRQHIQDQDLTEAERWNIIQSILSALNHAHQATIIHRNITPDTILISSDGIPYLTGFDYARIQHRNSTIAGDIAEAIADNSLYQSLECYRNPAAASPQSDLCSAGLVFYELLTGRPAFSSPEEMCDRAAQFSILPSDLNPALSAEIDTWLQTLCALDPQSRHRTAEQAQLALSALLTRDTPVQPAPLPAAQSAPPSIDLENLPVNTVLNDRYRILERLGQPGSFAVAYKIWETWAEKTCVLKLITRDRYSCEGRLMQEYQILSRLPEHPSIVAAVWADKLKDGTPFIVLDFVDGQSLEAAIASAPLSLETTYQIAQAILEGVHHIHQHDIYHQDIKPANILLIDQGIKLIDFNVAVLAQDPDAINAGTRRYMPPDLFNKPFLSEAERIDRDLYGVGLVLYECLTGRYPFPTDEPPLGQAAAAPTDLDGCHILDPAWNVVLLRAIAPKHSDRFTSAAAFLAALPSLTQKPLVVQEKGSMDLDTAIVESSQAEPSLPPKISPEPRLDPAALPVSLVTDHPIILDPSNVYPVPAGHISIRTEVEWLQHLGRHHAPCWVSGQRLCHWAEDWLRVWNQMHRVTIQASPRSRLEQWLAGIAIPDDWNDTKVLSLVVKLDTYPDEDAIASVLASQTKSDPVLWHPEPSREHLAQWLTVAVPSDLQPLEQAWCQALPPSDWTSFYQPDHKLDILRQWLGLQEPSLPILGNYPHPIPSIIQAEFEQFWQQRLYRNHAQDLDNLDLARISGGDRVAELAFTILIQRPQWITRDRTHRLFRYLTSDQRRSLDAHQAYPLPTPLPLEASPEETLQWVTDQYLPFRQWEIISKQPPIDQQDSTVLAESFVNWILEHYPTLKEDPVETSHLNYHTGYQAQEQALQHPVLWVVIDGLGWLDHQDLIRYLTESNTLRLETEPQPLFSILPTKTEYAKWSLYSQRLPNRAAPKVQAAQGFNVKFGKRYTDAQLDQLYKDLRRRNYQLYCWDTTEFDAMFHHHTDWLSLYSKERSLRLKVIAERIHHCLDEYPDPDALRIVIASDHGQMLGITPQMSNPPPGLTLQGRMALGATDDPRFVVLESDRFAVPEHVSVVRGAGSLNAYSYTTNQGVIGSHGGLFPEEVIVGYSILRRQIQRSAVLVHASGTSHGHQNDHLSITIQNTNSVSLSNLCLHIQEIPELSHGYYLDEYISWIAQGDTVTVDILLPHSITMSGNHQENHVHLSLQGHLSFQYAGTGEMGSAILDPDSHMTIQRMFTSGFEIDDFL